MESASAFKVVIETRFPRNVQLSEFVNELVRVRKEYMYLSTAKAAITRELNRWLAEGYQWREEGTSTQRQSRWVEIEHYEEGADGSAKLSHAGQFTFRIYRVEDGALVYYTDQYMFTGR